MNDKESAVHRSLRNIQFQGCKKQRNAGKSDAGMA